MTPRTRVLAGVSGSLAALMFMPLLLSHDDAALAASRKLSMPSIAHPFGTDALGRDIALRLLTGAHTTLLVVGIAVCVSTLLALLVALPVIVSRDADGVSSSRWQRVCHTLDMVTLRFADMLRAVPRVLLVISLVGLLSRTDDDRAAIWRLALLLGVTGWMPLTRLLRDFVAAARRANHIQAALALGLTPWRLFWRHEAPAIWPSLLVWLTASVAELIVLEAGLSFLGVGVPVTAASWGTVLRDVGDVFGNARWLMIGPGVVIGGTVAGIQWAADYLAQSDGPSATKQYNL